MSNPARPDPGSLALRFATSALQGLLLYGIHHAASAGIWPGTEPALFFPLLSLLLVLPGTYYLTADLTRARGYGVALAAMAALLIVVGVHQGATAVPDASGTFFGNDKHHVAYAVAIGAIWFHGLPFIQSWLATGRARPEYATLFALAWRNCLRVALAVVFTGALWLLLGLWAQLFRSIGIRMFAELFTSAKFVIPATAIAAGIGAQLAGSVENLQGALRRQLLTLFKWLTPLAALIVGLFSCALIMKSGELFAQGRSAINAGWLLALVVATIYLLNAAYQDGSEDAPYPRLLGSLVRFSMPLLAAIAVLAAWAVGVRIVEYGLTVARVWAALVSVIALAYSLGYAWAAFRPGAWMARMGSVNVGVALGTAVVLALMLTPALSPSRLAAASQEARILARAPGFDGSFAELGFETDSYGRKRLERLAKEAVGKDAADLRERARLALDPQSRWSAVIPLPPPPPPQRVEDLVFQIFPAGRTVPMELRQAVRDGNTATGSPHCGLPDPCALLYVDLDGDGADEAVTFSQSARRVYTRGAGGWTLVGNIGAVEPITREFIVAGLEAGRYLPREPRWQALEVDGKVLTIDIPWMSRTAARPPLPVDRSAR